MSDDASVGTESAASAAASDGVGLADDVLIPILAEYLPHQRWFSAKGQELGTIEIIGRAVAARDLDGSDIEQVLFTVDTLFGKQRYQLWIGWSWGCRIGWPMRPSAPGGDGSPTTHCRTRTLLRC